MLAPTVPPLSNNRKLQDAVRAIKAVCNALMVNVIVVVLPPQARYMAAPCCLNHMGGWSATLSPLILMESILFLDRELVEVFSDITNAVYISVTELAAVVEGRNTPVHAAWAPCAQDPMFM